MPDSSIKDGWQRFLDRLRRLWGRLRPGEFANGPTVNMGAGVPLERRAGLSAVVSDCAECR